MRSMKLFRKRKEPPEAQAKPEVMETRRALLNKVGLGALLTGIFGQGLAFLRSLVPNVLYEEPRRFKVGLPDQFAEGATFLEDKRLFVFRERNTFYAISATCTHLGCTVKMINLNQPKKVQIKGQPLEVRREFHCPCHGSKFYGDGTNYAGPAPTPLAWHKLELAPDDGQLVVNLSETVNQDFRLTV